MNCKIISTPTGLDLSNLFSTNDELRDRFLTLLEYSLEMKIFPKTELPQNFKRVQSNASCEFEVLQEIAKQHKIERNCILFMGDIHLEITTLKEALFRYFCSTDNKLHYSDITNTKELLAIIWLKEKVEIPEKMKVLLSKRENSAPLVQNKGNEFIYELLKKHYENAPLSRLQYIHLHRILDQNLFFPYISKSNIVLSRAYIQEEIKDFLNLRRFLEDIIKDAPKENNREPVKLLLADIQKTIKESKNLTIYIKKNPIIFESDFDHLMSFQPKLKNLVSRYKELFPAPHYKPPS